MSIIFREATSKDAPRISEISNENRLKRVNDKSKGFLVAPFGVTAYKLMVKGYPHFFVIEQDGAVIGFSYGITRSQLGEGVDVNQVLIEHDSHEFFIIKQICVVNEAKGKGFRTRMYEEIERRVQGNIYALFLEKRLKLPNI